MSNRASLNHIYRTVWNQALGAMVAVAEIETGGGPSGGTRSRNRANALKNAFSELAWPPGLAVMPLSIAIGFSGLSGYFADAHAQTLPQGGVAIHGTATSNYSQPGRLTVTTTNGAGTAHSATNWNSFSIGAGATTQINQPNAASMSINRVVTNTPSQLFGTLSSNGRVVLVNQSGIAVGAGALIDTAGFTASAVGMKDADALAGRLRFGGSELGNHTGALNIEGNIIARGGDVVLIAPSVDLAKTAVVEAKNGSVSLVAGQKVEITGRGLEGITLEVQAPADQAINLGSLKGDAVGIFAGTLKHSGLIQAVTADMQGGKVVLRATGDARVDGNAQVLARGDAAGAKGGTVDVLGNRVALADNTLIDASGQSGGGKIRVGGGFQGKEADVANAARTFVGPNTALKADAVTAGDGGTVIVWADEQTKAYGNISAQGGAQAGDGGFVEVSGKQRLTFEAKVNALAPNGKSGTLLLDPNNIDIVSGGGSNISDLTQVDEFSDGPGFANLDVALINSAGATVVLQAQTDINVDAAINMANPGVGITMQAGRYLAVNQSITTKAGVVSLIAHDPGGGNSEGAIYVNAAIDTTGAGSFAGGAPINLTNDSADTGSTSILLNANVNAGNSSAVHINGLWVNQSVNSAITAANLGVMATAGGADLNSVGNNFFGSVAINAQGPVTFRNSAGNFLVSSVGGANGITGTGAVTISTTGSMSTEQLISSVGNLTITASNGVSLSDDVIANAGAVSINTSGNGNILQSGGSITAGSGTSLNAGLGAISLGSPFNNLQQLSVTSAGNLSVQNGGGALGLNNITAGTVSITGQGNLYSYGASISSTSHIALTSTAGAIDLAADGPANLTTTTGNITIAAAGALRLGTTTGSILGVELTAGGPVTQAAALSTTGPVVVNAGTNSVTLNQTGNHFVGFEVTGGAVSVTHDTGALTLGNVAASSSLNLVVGGGQISQLGGTAITAPSATFTAVSNDITLTNAGNNVGTLIINPGLLSYDAGNVSWYNSGPLVLGEVNAVSLLVSTMSGTLTQTAAPIKVAFGAAFNAGEGGGIDLSNSSNNFNSVGFSGGAVRVRDIDDLAVTALAATSADVQAAGILTLWNNPFTVSGDLHLLGGTSLTTLNDLSGANVYLQSNNGNINLGNGTVVNSAGLLNMAANNGSINAASALLSVGTTTSATATNGGNVTMSHSGNSFGSSVSLSGAAIDVRAASAMNVSSLTQTAVNQPVRLEAGGLLTLPATGINTGTADLTLKSGLGLTTHGDLVGTNVSLQSVAGHLRIEHDITGFGDISLTANAGRVIVSDATVGDTLTIRSSGAGAATVTLSAFSGIDLYGNVGLLRDTSANSVEFRLDTPGTTSYGNTVVYGLSGQAFVTVGNAGWFLTDTTGVVSLEGLSTIKLPDAGFFSASFENRGVLNINSGSGWSFLSDPASQAGNFINRGVVNVNGTSGSNATSWEAKYSQTAAGTLNIGAGKYLSMQHGDLVEGTVNFGANSTIRVSEQHASSTQFNSAFTGSATGTLEIAPTVSVGFGATSGTLGNLNVMANATGYMANAGSALTVGNYTQGVGSDFSGPGALTITQSYNNPTAAAFQPTGTVSITHQSGNLNIGGASPMTPFAMALSAPGGNLNLGGNVATTGGDLILSGVAVNASGNLSGADLSIQSNGSGINLAGDISATGTLIMQTNGDSINAATALFNVGGNTTAFATFGGHLTMSNADNSFGNAVYLQGAAIDVRAASPMAVGALGQTAPNQPLRLEAGGLLTLPNTALNTGTSDLTLKSGGALTTPGALTGNNIYLQSASGALAFGEIQGANLSVVSNGAVTQLPSTNIAVGGLASFNAGSGDITLNGIGNNIYALGIISAGNVAINNNASNFELQNISAASLSVVAGGNVDSSATISTTLGGLTIQAAGNLDLAPDGVATLSSAGALSLTAGGFLNASGTVLGFGINNDFSLIAGGNLQLPAGAIDAGTGNITLETGGLLSTPGHLHGGNINLTATTGIVLNGNVVTGNAGDAGTVNLVNRGFGDIANAGGDIVTQNLYVNFAGTGYGNIDLGDALGNQNNVGGTVRLVSGSGGFIKFNNSAATYSLGANAIDPGFVGDVTITGQSLVTIDSPVRGQTVEIGSDAGIVVAAPIEFRGSYLYLSSSVGDIQINSPIARNAVGDASLYVNAGRHIDVNAGITSSGSKLNVSLVADGQATGIGAVTVNSSINTLFGNFEAYAGSDFVVNAAIRTGGEGSNINIGSGGSIIVNAGRDIVLGVPGTELSSQVQTEGGGYTTGNGGDISLTAGRNISGPSSSLYSGAIKYQSGSTGQHAGDISLVATTGSVSIGEIFAATDQNDSGGDIGRGGNVTISAGDSISVLGPIRTASSGGFYDYGDTTNVASGGAITLAAGTGTVTLSGALTSSAFNGGPNGGTTGTGGAISIAGGAGVVFSSDINAGTGDLTLASASGGIVQSGGNITAARTTLSAGGDVSLPALGNQFGRLGVLPTAGIVTVASADASLWLDNITADGFSVLANSIASDNVITVGAGGLRMQAIAGGIYLSPDNSATIVSGGNVTLLAVRDIDVPYASFTLPAGGVLAMNAGGSLHLPNSGLNVGATGTINLQSGEFVYVNGPLTAYDVTISSYDSIALNADVNAAHLLSMSSTVGDVTQNSGTITAPASTTVSANGTIDLSSSGNDFYVISATTSNGDITISDGVGDLEYYSIAAGGSVYINAQGALLKHSSGGTYIQSNGSGYGSINLSASSIGTPGTPVLVNPGTDSVYLVAGSGGIAVQQQAGVMNLSNYSISAAGVGQEIRLLGSTGAGNDVNVSFGGWSLNTENDDIAILATGAGANVNANGLSRTGRQFALGALGSGGSVNIGSDGVILYAANGVDLFSLGGNVNLDGNLRNDLGFLRLTAGNSILGNGFTTITTTGGNFEATANASLSGPYGAFLPSGSGSVQLDTIDTSGASGNAGGTSVAATGQNGGNVTLAVTGGNGTVTVSSISTYGGNGVADSRRDGQPGGNGGNVLISAPGNMVVNVTIDSSGGAGAHAPFGDDAAGNGGNAGNISVMSTSGTLNFSGVLYAIGGTGGDAQNGDGYTPGGTAGLAGTITLAAAGNLNFDNPSSFNNSPGLSGFDSNGFGGFGSAMQPIILSAASISQSLSAALNAGGLIVRFTATSGSVALNESANLFGEMDGTATGNISIVGLSGVGDNGMTSGGNLSLTGIAYTNLAIQGPLAAVDIALTSDNEGISLMDNIFASGNLSFDVGNCGCPINQTQGSISAIGITTVHAGLSDVTLSGNSNSFNQLAINPLNAAGQGGIVSVYSTTPLNLLDVNAGTLLLATTNDAIVQQAGTALAVGGAVTFDTGTGNISLANAGNSFGSLGIQSGGNVVIRNASALLGLHGLNAGSIDLQSAGDIGTDSNITTTAGALTINAGGDINLATDASAIVTSQGATTIRALGALDVYGVAFNSLGGGNLVLGAGGNLSASLSTVNFATGGRWLTYLSNPGASHVFGIFDPLALVAGDFRQVKAPFGTVPARGTGNGSLWSDEPTGISLTLGGTVNKTYDGGTGISTTGAFVASVSGLLFGESTVGLAGTTATLSDKHAGTGKTVVFNGSFGPVVDGNTVPTYGYVLPTTVSANIADVARAALVVSAVADSRSYDGTSVSASAPTVGGSQFDAIGTAATQAFDTKHAGTGKTLTASGLVMNDGNSGNNYLVSYVPVGTGTITQAALTVSAQTDSRTYDGTTNSAAAPIVGGSQFDAVGTAATQSFDTKHATGGKTLTASGFVMNDGNGGNNYAITYTPVSTGVITQAALTVTAQTDSRTYDGTTASAAAPSISGSQFDTIATAASQVFDTKHAGSGKTLTASGLVMNDGNGGNNYAITYTPVITGTITQAALTVTAQSDSRTYNGTTSSAVAPSVSGSQFDSIGTAAMQTFDTKHAGTGKTITASGLVMNDGNSGNNYAITYTQASTGTITQAALTVTAQTDSRTYDGTTGSAVAPNISGSQFDSIGTAATQAFDTKHAGTGKTLTPSGLVMNDGNGGNNYAIAYSGVVTGSIGQATLTLNSASDSKTYDGNTSSAGVVGNSGLVGGDTVSGASQTYASKNVLGTGGSTLQVAGYTVNDGNSGNNYTVTSNTAAGTISKANLTVAAATDSKTYDGTTASAGTASAIGLVGGDTLGSSSQSFASRNAMGTGGSTLQVDSFAINDGNSGGNYNVTASTAAGTINKANLSVSAASDSKTYDGTTSSTGTASVVGLVGGDTLSSNSQAFASKNVLGTGGSTLQVGSFSVNDGNSGGNYNLTTNTASGTITKANLTLSAAAGTKTYDGNTSSAGVVGNSGLVGGDTVSGASQTFDSKNAGSRTLAVAGYTVNDGNSGGNYNVITNTAAGSIGKATLSAITGVTATNKTYDGNTSAVVNTSLASGAGVIGSDVVTVTGGTGNFSDKNAGLAKLVTVGGLTLGGTDGGNYQFVGSTTTTANINKALLTGVSGVTAIDKVYDGNTVAALNTTSASISGLIPGDDVSVLSGVGAFADRHVGTGKPVAIVGINLGGADGGNYTFGTFSSSASANITQRALSTWTGSGSNRWSDAASWDALPDAANVRAVSIPSGDVVFDSGVGATQLERISSSGRLIMNGGLLTVSDSLRTLQFGQTGGLLNGTGQLIVERTFLKTGGAIDMGGLVDITQSSGVLNVGGMRGGNLSFKAESGGITQSGPLATPGVLATQATEAILLNHPENRISEFAALTTTGGVELTNIGPLNILGIGARNGYVQVTNTGGIRTTGLIAAPLGKVKLTANSPITIGPDGIIALGDIELIATNLTSAGNMLINGNLISTGGAISLDAANNLTQNASLSATGAITAQAGGEISFGPVAISSGSPVSYRAAAGAVANPPATISELISRKNGGGTGGGVLEEFLSKFEEALDIQQSKSDDETLKKKKQGDVVVEGETCRP